MKRANKPIFSKRATRENFRFLLGRIDGAITFVGDLRIEFNDIAGAVLCALIIGLLLLIAAALGYAQ